MSGLLSVLLGFPTVVFTGLLGLMMLYWLFVILGALDIDMFHADADGALEGLDGAAKGALEGAAKGAFELVGATGKVDAAADAVGGAFDGADGALDAANAVDGIEGHGQAAAGLLHALNLRRAPVTVTFSFIVFFGWVLSYFGVTFLASTLGAVLPVWLFSTLVLFGASAAALPLASLATMPLQKVFTTTPARRRIDFVGSEVRIRTGKVDGGFGQAELSDGESNLIINVRNDSGTLQRGDRALVIDFDREKDAYIVEAYDTMLEDDVATNAKEVGRKQ